MSNPDSLAKARAEMETAVSSALVILRQIMDKSTPIRPAAGLEQAAERGPAPAECAAGPAEPG